jgi:hypothetical protein
MTRAQPGLYELRDAIRTARDRVWSAGSVADLLAVASDLSALANAIHTAARRQQRIGRP